MKGKRLVDRQERISPGIRVLSGIIGISGFAAIAFNASEGGGIKADFMLFASFFAGFIFVYVAWFGTYPWDRKDDDDVER
jgi:hypothetical protein